MKLPAGFDLSSLQYYKHAATKMDLLTEAKQHLGCPPAQKRRHETEKALKRRMRDSEESLIFQQTEIYE